MIAEYLYGCLYIEILRFSMPAIIYYQNPCKLPVSFKCFPGRFSKNWWWATKFWFGHLSLIDKKIKSFDTLSLKIRPRTPGIRLFMMLLLWESVGRRRHLRLESLWMAMNLNRNDIMTVWNKCFFFMSQTIIIFST